MKRILLLSMMVCVALVAQAQPTKRRTTTSTAAAQARPGSPASGNDRASLMFPTSEPMPEDVVWRRDIYRQLDLTKDKNAPLYYPVQPAGPQVNLFTYLFRLLLTGRVPAYNYKLDGNESFAAKDRIGSVKELLDRYYIYYEEKDGRYNVADNDVPSAQVTRYYIKESIFLDQRTGTYKTRVVALCPILIEDDGFGGTASSKPLFWMNYEDLAPYLSRLPVMASNLNNVTNMTADDFFTLNRYEGTIYKTNNMQGRVLADYCKTDTALAREQKKIEAELADFEKHIWKVEQKKDSADTTAVDTPAKKTRTTTRRTKETAVEAGSTARRTSSTRRSSSSVSKPKSSSSSSRSSATPRVSARRTRR